MFAKNLPFKSCLKLRLLITVDMPKALQTKCKTCFVVVVVGGGGGVGVVFVVVVVVFFCFCFFLGGGFQE